jgi:P pilus assembly chaperone PapD
MQTQRLCNRKIGASFQIEGTAREPFALLVMLALVVAALGLSGCAGDLGAGESQQSDRNHRQSGTGTEGHLSASPSSVNFGSVVVGSNGSQTITLSNSGTASVTLSAASASGSGFSVSGLSTPLTITAGQTANFSAGFAPASTGSVSGSISVASNAPGSPLTIALSGTGIQAQLSATPSSASFGSVVTGNTNSQTITLKNSGSASLTISQASVSGTGFSISGLSASTTIAAGASTSFSATFAPTLAGSVSGSISLTNSGPSSPLAISLSGTGVAATHLLGVSPTTLSFGNVTDGTNTSQSVTITNDGNSNVTISSASVAGTGFSVSGAGSGLVLTPSQTATLSVTFDPSSAGAVTGTVTVASNATNSPATVSLSGTGVQDAVVLSWTASTSSGVVGYDVYRGTSSGSYSQIASSVSGTTYTDSTVQSGQDITYYYVVTAVNSSGEQSSDSNQTSVTVP